MLLSALFAFLHFAAAFGIAATLFFEWFTLSPAPTASDARRLLAADRWYGISAGVLLVVGFIRVFYFEKGKDYYLSNPFFLLKLALFVAVGLLSIGPTVRFIGWSKQIRQQQAPVLTAAQYALLRKLLTLEMVLLLAILLCASLMAHGLR